jgi:hypothetical protein
MGRCIMGALAITPPGPEILQPSASFNSWVLRWCRRFVMGLVSSNNSMPEPDSSTRPVCYITFHVSTLLTFHVCSSAIASGVHSSVGIPATCVMWVSHDELCLPNRCSLYGLKSTHTDDLSRTKPSALARLRLLGQRRGSIQPGLSGRVLPAPVSCLSLLLAVQELVHRLVS